MPFLLSRRAFVFAPLAVAACGTASAQAPAVQTLTAEKVRSRFLDGGQETQHWRFRSEGPLPVIRARQGEPLELRFSNTIDEDIWIHFYGLRVEAASTTVLLPRGPDGRLDLTITPPDAGTFWIGPLLHQSRQREMGLTAMLVVEEAESPFADLPLLLDDWKIDTAGKIEGGFGDVATAAGEGRLGNWYTVNGETKPRLKLSRDKPTRLRLLNVCNARTLNVQFRNAELTIIALDGQPVKPMAFPSAGLQLAPGQRADVVPLAGEDEFALTLDLFEDAVEAAFFSHAGTLLPLPEGFALPANPWPAVDPAGKPRTIPVALEGGIKGGLQSAQVDGATLDLRGLLERGLAWALNGRAGLMAEPLFEVEMGETIILAFENRTAYYQPLAIDGHVWHQLVEDGQKTSGQFWRDTAVLAPKSKASFVFVADNPGLWTLSSLVAERADAGLIGGFLVRNGP